MSETRNIVVLGASFSGLGSAHYIAKHVLPKLAASTDATYALHVVDPSSHFWWHNAAPRAIVSTKEMKHENCFAPIKDAFTQYSNLKDSIIIHQAAATAVDREARTVTLQTHEGMSETLTYYALVIATGIRSPTALTTLQGDYTVSQKALEEMNVKLANARDIVIGGGGPIGVETAGEIATHLKGAKVTLVCGANKLLPILPVKITTKADKLLEKVGVNVLYNTKVESSEVGSDGKHAVTLSNGETLSADVYIPATGVKPNTEFLPAELKTEKGWVKTNGKTLRVDAAGPRVYAAGDVSAVDLGGVLNMFTTVPILGNNLAHDLLADAKLGSVVEKTYTRKDVATQLIPVGAKLGVGAFNGWSLPGFMVSYVKGKDYMVKEMPKIYGGKQWQKA